MGSESTGVLSSSIPRKFGRIAAIVVAALLIALLSYGLTTTSPDDTIDQRLREGRTAPAPKFELELLEPGRVPPPLENRLAAAGDDGAISIDELRGSPVVLNFWASWCGPCADEARLLQQGWKRWGKHGVIFVGLDMQDLRDDARAFLRRWGVDYPTIRDPGKKISRSYGATGIPETYFISPRGRVVAHVVGVVSADQLRSGVAGARAGAVVGKRQGGERRPAR
jgi:cytochrome c biogenesis protein CcmG, thiol:disulfide interchange protein DsbE